MISRIVSAGTGFPLTFSTFPLFHFFHFSTSSTFPLLPLFHLFHTLSPMRVISTIAFLVAIAASVAPAAQESSLAVLEGRVTAADDVTPIYRVRISIQSGGITGAVITDDQGRFQ